MVLTIPWHLFKEEEVHMLIEAIYINGGFKVRNAHKADKARERGADLIVSKDEEETAIAVKIKPNQKDISQLEQLKRRKEKNKVYIYIKEPTQDFLEAMKEKDIKKEIEFWNSFKLTEKLFEINALDCSKLILFNEPMCNEINDLWDYLHKIHEEAKNWKVKPSKQLDKYSFDLLWRLKDNSVQLNKGFEILLDFLERLEKIEFDEKEGKIFLLAYLSVLDNIYGKLSTFNVMLKEFVESNKELVLNVSKKTWSQSHWFMIFENGGPNSYNPNFIKKEYVKLVEEAKTKEFFELMKSHPTKFNGVLEALIINSRRLFSLGFAFESLIDDWFEEVND